MSNILVIGSNGQVGSEIRELVVGGEISLDDEVRFFFTDKSELDITDNKAVEDFVKNNNIEAIINCSAYTAVDKAESDMESANKINHLAVKNLAKISKEKNIKLIHISTDYVFDGTNYKPYTEDDAPNPQGVYGKTKLDGENAVLEINPPNAVIIRTSWVYSSYGANFVKTMLRLGSERESLGVVYDQIGSPTYAKDLARAILTIINNPKQSTRAQIYNYSNEGVVSWYDFAKEIMKMAKLECKISPIESREYPTPAKRPHYSVLNKAKIKADFGVVIPYWKDSLKECIAKIIKMHSDNFDCWNKIKKKLHNREDLLKFREKDIFFLSIGHNIGFEQNGKGNDFLKPVLVYKKFNKQTFLGIPLSTKPKDGKFYYSFEYKKGIVSTALLSQLKLFDIRRAGYRSGTIKDADFKNLDEKLKRLLEVTPLQDGGGARNCDI